ncbi:MAG: DNA mismatch repair protein MutS, partial [Spirochaetia bacterium]|nr:DNA mismatch repair protein MutS [Spirochaetia bacterium]
MSTGAFFSLQAEAAENDAEILFLRDVCARYAPREVLIPNIHLQHIKEALPEIRSLTAVEEWRSSPTEGARRLRERFGDLRPMGYTEGDPALGAAGVVLYYVENSFPGVNIRLNAPSLQSQGSVMKLDEQTIGNLDLVWNSQENGTKRTLFGILDFCRTQAGRRRLREAVIEPLTDREALLQRLAAVDLLSRDHDLRSLLSKELAHVHDLERISSRIAAKRAFPRDFPAVRSTIDAAARIAALLKGRVGRVSLTPAVEGLSQTIALAVSPEPPAALGKGPFIQTGIRRDLDDARLARDKGAGWILEFEAEERKRTGISNLRIKYNRVAGYFIEITKSQVGNVPPEYNRKQTLLGQERYATPRLAELEESILGAEEIIEKAEAEEFDRLCALVSSHGAEIAQLMSDLAVIDFLFALSEAAVRYNWTKPDIVAERSLVVVDGRHPVVEAFLPPGEPFIANSVLMGDENRVFALLTGPNMAGKSTYIRQTALIQILMQIGSFVPAARVEMSIADRVFTRIGAADNITRGESTFYVEMLETARILHQCTDDS